ncbi:MAG: AAA family ATPase [Bdellovibrionales bacterium]
MSLHPRFLSLIESAGQIVLDKKEAVQLATACLLAKGHILIEDVPGVGKTTLVQTLGALLGLETHRIQFTVDLLPSDLIGVEIFNSQKNTFDFKEGPLFASLIMADELNRASPRTQSALLQAMEESSITVDGQTRALPDPFLVIATQNPHQQSSTFPLPESQLDRFLMSLELQYASRDIEKNLILSEDPRQKILSLKPLFKPEEIRQAQKEVLAIKMPEVVADYITTLLAQSRQGQKDLQPLSTRSGLSLARASKAWAYLEGRQHVEPGDVQRIAVSVIAHRLGGRFGVNQGKLWAQELIKKTPVPV